jgi:spartin
MYCLATIQLRIGLICRFSNAIQGLTKIVANGITSASDYYITRATPHASVTNASGPTSTPAPRPIRWITSDRSKRNLSNIQGYSSQAVRISGKTMNIVEGLVARAVVPKPKTPHPTNPRASSRAKSDPIQPSPRGQVDLKLDPMPLKSRGQTVPGAKAKKTDLENDLLDVPAASDPPPVYSRNTPPPVHPASRTSSLQHVPLPVPSRVSSPAPPSLPVRRSSPVPRSLPPAPPTHPSVANRGSSSETLLQRPCNTGILPSPSPRPGSDSTSSATPQPREPLGISGRLVLSAALLSETMANSQAKLVSTSGDSVAAMMTRKYGIVAGTSTAAMIGTARDVTLVYMNTTGFVQDVTLRTAGRYVAQTQCNVGGRKYSLRTNGRGRVVQAEPA